MYLSQSTWQALGLNVVAGYAVLGGLATFCPAKTAEFFFGVKPSSTTGSTGKSGKLDSEALLRSGVHPAALGASGDATSAQADTDSTVSALMPLLGARDLSFATAMAILAYDDQWEALGTVILGGTLLCVADCWATWKARGPCLGLAMFFGAGLWAVTGYGLRYWY